MQLLSSHSLWYLKFSSIEAFIMIKPGDNRGTETNPPAKIVFRPACRNNHNVSQVQRPLTEPVGVPSGLWHTRAGTGSTPGPGRGVRPGPGAPAAGPRGAVAGTCDIDTGTVTNGTAAAGKSS